MNQEEKQFLDTCVRHNDCDRLLHQYWGTVRYAVIGSLRLRHFYYRTEDIEELRNEVFLRLFENEREKLRQYDESLGMSLKGWIKMIANQTVGMYLRKKDRAGRLGDSKPMPIDELSEEIGLADDSGRYEARDMLARIEEAMNKLSHLERLVLQLHFDQGMTWEDVASSLNRKLNNVYQIRYRAISHLKKIMEKSRQPSVVL